VERVNRRSPDIDRPVSRAAPGISSVARRVSSAARRVSSVARGGDSVADGAPVIVLIDSRAAAGVSRVDRRRPRASSDKTAVDRRVGFIDRDSDIADRGWTRSTREKNTSLGSFRPSAFLQ
jgi:hypothetical protein